MFSGSVSLMTRSKFLSTTRHFDLWALARRRFGDPESREDPRGAFSVLVCYWLAGCGPVEGCVFSFWCRSDAGGEKTACGCRVVISSASPGSLQPCLFPIMLVKGNEIT